MFRFLRFLAIINRYTAKGGAAAPNMNGEDPEMTFHWHGAHHDYGAWDAAPNAGLMYNNALFESIRDPGPLYLAHITAGHDGILKAGRLSPSAGCLVGSVYCVPTAPVDSKEFRLHNLGSYYFQHEIPRVAGSNIFVILVRIPERPNPGRAVEGVNYLRMGGVHFECFERTRASAFGQVAEEKLQNDALSRLSEAEHFLQRCVREHADGCSSTDASVEFLQAASAVVPLIPFLGYVLFEALSVSIMLFQEDRRSIELRERGEYNNWHYKELMYELAPQLSRRFRLSSFKPDWAQVLKSIDERSLLKTTRIERFAVVLAGRARKYICDNFFNDWRSFQDLGPRDLSQRVNWFHAKECVRPLLGHLIHRYLRTENPRQYLKAYRLVEEAKARDIWEYWSQKRIDVPFNAILPKGEVGFNPTVEGIRFYKADAKAREDDVFIRVGDELDLEMDLNLVHLEHSFRRGG